MTIDDQKRRSRRTMPAKNRGRIARTALAVMLVTIVVLLIVRQSVERTALTNLIARSTGMAVSIGSIADGLGSAGLGDLHLDAGGGLVLDVPSATVHYAGPVSIELQAPRLTFTADALTEEQRARLASTIGWFRSLHAKLAIAHGSVDGRATAAADPSLVIREANLHAQFDAQSQRYTSAFDVVAADTSYPVLGSSDGATATWTAAALPVQALGVFADPSAVALRSGFLRDVSLKNDAALQINATLDGVNATLGTAALADLKGSLAVLGDRIGSTAISGTFTGLPFTFSGEAHDLTSPWDALNHGTRDVRAAARLLAAIGARPNLTFARIELTAPGIVFGQYGVTSKAGPHVVQLLAIDPSESTIRLDTALSSDHVISKGERTSDLAVRTSAVAGVNGDYFDIGRTYEPQGMLIKSGVLLRSPTDRAALTIDKANHVTFGEFRMDGHVELAGRRYVLTQYNTWPLRDATIITPDYGDTLRPADGITFAHLTPLDETKHTYRVTSVETADHPIAVSFGVAFGPDAKGAHPRPGDVVKFDYTFTPPIGPDVVAAIGGGPILLRNGAWYEDPHAPAPDERDVRWPVVAIGTMSDGTILLAAVDGRHPERSVGLTRPEFGELLKRFGVTDAMALDSGGSVTMVARTPGDTKVTLHNMPSDNSAERYISDALLVFSSAPPNTIVTAPPSPTPMPSLQPAT